MVDTPISGQDMRIILSDRSISYLEKEFRKGIEPDADEIYTITVNNDVSISVTVSTDGSIEMSKETYAENDDGSTTETSTKIVTTEKGRSVKTTVTETQSITAAGETGVTSTVSTIAEIEPEVSASATMIVIGVREVTLSDSMADMLKGAPVINIDTNVSKVNMPSEFLNDANVTSVTVSVNSGSDNSARIIIPAGVIPAFDLTLNGTTTTSFVTDVTVSYDVSLPTDARNVRAYCIDTGEFMTATYVNGVATFSVPHFSSWTIVYDKPVIVVEDDDDILFILEQQKKAREAAAAASQTTTGDNSEEEVAVIIAAAAVEGAMLACAFFAFRRN